MTCQHYQSVGDCPECRREVDALVALSLRRPLAATDIVSLNDRQRADLTLLLMALNVQRPRTVIEPDNGEAVFAFGHRPSNPTDGDSTTGQLELDS